MKNKHAELLRWSAVVAVITLMTLAAFLSIYYMVLQGVIPQAFGLTARTNHHPVAIGFPIRHTHPKLLV
jgi:hypothetical protein